MNTHPVSSLSRVDPALMAEIAKIFAESGTNGCILIRSQPSDRLLVWNSERAALRFRPASTFKIFIALLALELGAVSFEERIPWDGSPTWSEEQQRTFSLEGAFRASAVWFFRILARRIGVERFREYLSRCQYGNADCGGTVEGFWLRGPLLISPLEQLTFLEDLKARRLGFSEKNILAVFDAMELEAGPGIRLRGKTGWIDETENYGWFAGYQETIQSAKTFVTHIDIPGTEFLEKRRRITERCLDLFSSFLLLGVPFSLLLLCPEINTHKSSSALSRFMDRSLDFAGSAAPSGAPESK